MNEGGELWKHPQSIPSATGPPPVPLLLSRPGPRRGVERARSPSPLGCRLLNGWRSSAPRLGIHSHRSVAPGVRGRRVWGCLAPSCAHPRPTHRPITLSGTSLRVAVLLAPPGEGALRPPVIPQEPPVPAGPAPREPESGIYLPGVLISP